MHGSGKHVRRTVIRIAILFVIWFGVVLAVTGSVWPRQGEKKLRKGAMTVDVSFAKEGYVQVQAKSSKKLKLRISRGDDIYTYDLNGENKYEVFPLQMGSGKYVFSLYKCVKGSKYTKEAEVKLSITLDSETAPFLCPSQYVNYSPDSPAIQKAAELCEGLQTDREKVTAVRDFMTKGFTYDYLRALTITENYLGDVDGCFESRIGLCQDLAAVAAAMLRSQGVPTQLVIGYVDTQYHAWNNVYVEGSYKRLDITAILSGFQSKRVYTAERYY